MEKVVLSIGSNLGDRLENLQTAVTKISGNPRISNVVSSSVYETAPFGGPEQDDFLNAVLLLETDLSAEELLTFAQQLETQANRVREVRWGPRTLDVDILTYGDEIHESETLTIPHPRIAQRAFVLVPWFEIDPSATIPALGKLADLTAAIDKSGVQLNRDMKLKVSI